MREGRRLLQDVLTLASHTTTRNHSPTPHRTYHHDQLTLTRSSSRRLAVNTGWVIDVPAALLAQLYGGRAEAP